MEFWDGIINLLFMSGKLPDDFNSSRSIAFAVGSGFMGGIVIVLDWLAFSLLGRTFFNLNHGGLNSVRFIFLWGIASAIGGYLSAVADVFQITRLGCLCVGVLGPLILPKIKEATGKKEPEQDATKEDKDETK